MLLVPKKGLIIMPYYSDYQKRRGLGVYHTYNDCPDGNNIEPKYRREGTGGLPKCPKCKRRDALKK